MKEGFKMDSLSDGWRVGLFIKVRKAVGRGRLGEKIKSFVLDILRWKYSLEMNE